jgi:hypothetical protein
MKAPDQMRESLEAAQTRLEEQLGLTFEHMDEGFRPLLDEAEKLQRRGGRVGTERAVRARSKSPAAAPTTPVPVTRGSGTPPKGQPTGKNKTGRGVRRGSI